MELNENWLKLCSGGDDEKLNFINNFFVLCVSSYAVQEPPPSLLGWVVLGVVSWSVVWWYW